MNPSWYINRLKAMSPAEVAWRLSQKRIEKRERTACADRPRVDEGPLAGTPSGLKADWSCLSLNLCNEAGDHECAITLLGGFDFETYRTRWHAGFQTQNDWSLEFAYDLHYKQRDDVGDARTNWELNRCTQFALLAKGFYASADVALLCDLAELEESWAAANPYLWGIAWTSTMEVAIRCINWMYAAAFLAAVHGEQPARLAARFEAGAANMAAYVAAHYSRYSSANNHAIVEACALGLAGFAFGFEPWQRAAQDILAVEVPRQNHEDGVNKEQSLHYQVFFLEAMGLYLLACRRNGVETPREWRPLLAKMCGYVQDCRVAPGIWLEFGDDDEGIILNLCGPKPDACEYVLQLMGVVLDGGERWAEYGDDTCETLCWIAAEGELATAAAKPLRKQPRAITYPQGGVSIMRSADGRVVAGMDHGPLGFGSIAAHGHADALSLQLYVDGRCVIGDPGTYLYHCAPALRDDLRRTRNHSTANVDGADQSEMLGAFMWGKRAVCELREAGEAGPQGAGYRASARHDGYAPVTHTRTLTFDGARRLEVTDEFEGLAADAAAEVVFAIPNGVDVALDDTAAGPRARLATAGREVARIACESVPAAEPAIAPMPYSPAYAVTAEGTRVSFRLAPGIRTATTHIEVAA